MQFIIITKKRVIQAKARSRTYLLNVLSEVGIEWLHVEQIEVDS